MTMRNYLIILAAAILMAACGTNRNKEVEKINQIERQLSTIDISTEDSVATMAVDMYRKFAADFPEDSLAPEYLKRAADISINIGQADVAIEILDSIISIYPGYEDVAGCQFMKGYAYETIEEYDNAREAYMEFVEKYPDHYLASDTKKILPYIGMSPEAMFEALMNAASDENLVQRQ